MYKAAPNLYNCLQYLNILDRAASSKPWGCGEIGIHASFRN